MAFIVSRHVIQITPKLIKAINERFKLKRGEEIYRVDVLVAHPPKPSPERKRK